jgi:hypothetical protein
MPGMKLITPISLLSALPLALAACAPPGPVSDTAPPPPAATPQGTRVLDKDAAAKLVNNAGLTLQWIGWDRRGTAYARFDGDVLRLTGRQSSEDGAGQLMLDGVVSEIGTDYFVFDGTIAITDTPDKGRDCRADKTWRFAVTQNRPYWRLREFEWCDRLTDYIDIYHPGTRP